MSASKALPGEESMRIGFLFNHDQIHQVAHGLPIALALAKQRTGAEIIICSANERITREIRILAGKSLGRDLKLVELGLASKSSLIFEALAGRLIPASKLLMYRDNLEFFSSLDALVVPEKTSLLLKDRFGLRDLKMIHVRHGAGDRAIGFNKASARFDHVLAAGPKIRDRLVAEAGVSPDKISVIGYPKFDLFPLPTRAPLETGRRPVVLYNPHVAPHLSSWYKSGRDVLSWFADHREYELIFAPHIMLFERKIAVTIQPPRLGRPGSIPKGALDAENILVDVGSRALTTMDYLNRADIYLGDASSQVYEYLIEPRPCIFLNAHGFDWERDKNFAHWQLGPVLDSVDRLGETLLTVSADHRSKYRSAQEAMLHYTFDLNGTPSSVRAAQVIMEVAGCSGRAVKRSKRPAPRRPAIQPVPAFAATSAIS
jgi:hypothetical protein